uniref:Uncharacterized protein n=1 Tax=Rhizophora mucronata TaxID=61149 RepID=A0A2P2Q2B4_RHIMU
MLIKKGKRFIPVFVDHAFDFDLQQIFHFFSRTSVLILTCALNNYVHRVI